VRHKLIGQLNSLRRLAAAVALLLVASAGAAGAPALKAGVFEPPRQAPDFSLASSTGRELKISDYRGKVVVLNFWTTWCGPCREMEPHFEKIAAQFARETNVQFYAVNCDDDETLVAPYLSEEKAKTAVLFSDGLDRFLRVDSFPTTVILDRTGKIAFRMDGFDPDTIEKSLNEAITRTLH